MSCDLLLQTMPQSCLVMQWASAGGHSHNWLLCTATAKKGSIIEQPRYTGSHLVPPLAVQTHVFLQGNCTSNWVFVQELLPLTFKQVRSLPGHGYEFNLLFSSRV